MLLAQTSAPPSPARRASAVVFGLVTGACGGAAPLLHPAHTLDPGTVTLGGGVSGTFVAGGAESNLARARAVTSSGGATTPAERETLTAGTIVSVLATPGVAPWVGGRAGVAERTEAGLGYTGRWARVDARHAFEKRELAVSMGLGLLALLPHPSADRAEPSGTSGAIAGVDSNGLAGFGIDVPVIVGYRSDAELVQAWAGLRGGFEQSFGNIVLDTAWPSSADVPDMAEAPPYEARFDARRIGGGALVGLAIGIHPVWVAVEVTGRYFSLAGNLRRAELRSHAELDGFSVEPAGALIGRF